MKTLILLTTFIFSVGFLFAQELTVKYEMIMKSDNPEYQAQISMMQGSTFSIYVKGNKSRTEISMGGLITTTTITDTEEMKGVLIMDGMLGKQAALFDEKDKTDEETNETEELEIELIDETKVILGHTCKKAIIYTEDEGELIYWYTEEYKPKEGVFGNYVKKDVPGLALEFSIEKSEMTMVFTATEFKEKVKETKGMFDLKIPEGYTEKSFEEISNMSGQ